MATLFHRTTSAFLVLLLAAAGCAKAEYSAAKHEVVADSSELEAEHGGEDGDATPVGRALIRTGSLEVIVKESAAANAALGEKLAELGGFVAASNRQSVGEDSWVMRLTVRVPAERFEEAIAFTRTLGEVTHEQTGTEDVTDKLTDLDARLKNARRLEERLLELVKENAADMPSLLAVERELARVRETIETLDAKQQALGRRVALATLSISLYEEEVAPPAPGFWSESRHVLTQSWNMLLATIHGLALFLIGALPWVIPLGAIGLWAWRRRRR